MVKKGTEESRKGVDTVIRIELVGGERNVVFLGRGWADIKKRGWYLKLLNI